MIIKRRSRNQSTFIVPPVHVAILLGEQSAIEGDLVPRLAIPLLDPPQVRGLPVPVFQGFVVWDLGIVKH